MRLSCHNLLVVSVVMLVLLAAASRVTSRSTGPPASEPEYFDQVCKQMTPSHASLDPQSGNGGYLIDTNLSHTGPAGFSYSAGQTYKGTACYSRRNY